MTTEVLNPRGTLSVAVLSGKGGVGKTNLTLNLAYALFKAKHKLLAMDFDVGLANIDVLMGISPEKNLQDLLQPGVKAEDVMTAIEEGGFDFLPAASGVPELLDLDDDMRDAVFDKLNLVLGNYDYVFFDLGAGIGKTVLNLARMVSVRILVVTPEPTALTDCYAVIKVLKNKHGLTDFQLVVNQASTVQQGKETFDRLHAVCKRFLDLDLTYLGAVHTDSKVHEAVRRQIPFIKHAPRGQASRDVLSIAIKLGRLRAAQIEQLKNQDVVKKLSPV